MMPSKGRNRFWRLLHLFHAALAFLHILESLGNVIVCLERAKNLDPLSTLSGSLSLSLSLSPHSLALSLSLYLSPPQPLWLSLSLSYSLSSSVIDGLTPLPARSPIERLSCE